MKHFYLITFLAVLLLGGCSNNQSFGQSILKLNTEITLPDVKGRIDHLDIDMADQIVFVAALGNNTVEVVSLKTGKILHTITGLSEPQGVVYINKHHELFVANGSTGECLFFNTADWQKTASIKYDDDADDARYDTDADQIYVGYGSGGIGIIDAGTHKQIANIQLPAHPESFQVDTKANRLWVNLPEAGMIGIADIKQHKLISEWRKILPRANFPMAYDAGQHRIIVGYRLPATLKVMDSNTGKEISSSHMAGDADDIYWDDQSKQILVSGGSGSINVFEQTGESMYKEVANIHTRDGARTSLWIPQLHLFIVASRAAAGHEASLLIYGMGK